jgi:hypothetical protein
LLARLRIRYAAVAENCLDRLVTGSVSGARLRSGAQRFDTYVIRAEMNRMCS